MSRQKQKSQKKLQGNLRYWMEIRQVSSLDLAKSLYLTRPAVTNWLRRESVPTAYISSICKALRITPNELFGWEETICDTL